MPITIINIPVTIPCHRLKCLENNLEVSYCVTKSILINFNVNNPKIINTIPQTIIINFKAKLDDFRYNERSYSK